MINKVIDNEKVWSIWSSTRKNTLKIKTVKLSTFTQRSRDPREFRFHAHCQAQIGIPEGKRFDNLPSSFLHNSLLSLLAVRRSGEGNEISCSTCQKKSAEINYCFNCEKFMCPNCVKAHEVFRDTSFQGHKVTPVRRFQAIDYEAWLKRHSFCSEKYHEKQITNFFCVGQRTTK